MKRKLALVKNSPGPVKPVAKGLLTDVRELILATRQTVAQGVNSALVLLYWKIGRRIRTDILKDKRAGYGEGIVATLSAQLMPDFGSGFAVRNLRRMIQFGEVFPDGEIVSTLSTQLNWSHFIELLPLNKPYQRDFYAEMSMFCFIHAADPHLDSPLEGLEAHEGAPVGMLRGATRRAIENLVNLAITGEMAT